MRRLIRIPLLAAAIIFLGATAAVAIGQVGEPAAGFTLEDTQGNWHSLQDYRDNSVVLLNMIGYS